MHAKSFFGGKLNESCITPVHLDGDQKLKKNILRFRDKDL